MSLFGSRGKKTVFALFDSGASKSLIRRDLARDLGPLVELPEPERFEMVRGRFIVRDGCVASVGLGRAKPAHLFRAVERLSEDLIVGADFLQQWDVRLEPRRKKIVLDPRALRLKAVGHRPQ
ncbi:MAG: retroviral-like aspartic protease [Planctomycetes bacterium]|nr:retroviral-like aspartic protease [Planctomycetota bacterium]